ncbi:MAG TPA: 16S rRNA (adenine(1518)-N(6)/adenine(1519)-N(6))-dimethyltransferase RsmA [Chloroflexota bacterium]|nr:16S rRNA (adenine(1518)-N(6)/adenine(1519)-N(6))-dimethyltransferase RsmA [Chloroflexota bacterium]
MALTPSPDPKGEPSSDRRVLPSTLPEAPEAIRTLLRALGMRPQKGFGQNFLVNDEILSRVVAAAEVAPNDVVLEVGPGLGHLTRHLARQAGRVIAVEVDRGMVRYLRSTFQGVPNVEIVENDVLKVEPGDLVGEHAYKVVANLPFYITSAVLRHFFEAARRPSLLVVMLQREVAYRILTAPGDLNLLAISVQVYGKARLITRVPASAFYPRPKVDSIVLRIDVYDQPKLDVDPEKFFKVVAAGFAMPRKQIHNSLAQRLWMPPGAATESLEAAGIDPMRRPQTLAIAEWDLLTKELEGRGLV